MHFGTSDYYYTVYPDTEYGSRNPSIFFRPGSTKLYVSHAVNGNNKYDYEFDTPLVLNEWSKVKISQLKTSDGSLNLKIELNGETLHQVINSQPKVMESPGAWATSGHPDFNTKSPPAKAQLRKIKLVTHNCPFGKTWSGTDCIDRGKLS